MKTILVTGSSGLVGSAVCRYFARLGYVVHGIDSDKRALFFGPEGSVRENQKRLQAELVGFVHHESDICDRYTIDNLVGDLRPNIIVHAAAQPSHEYSARLPFLDFEVNAVGTLNMLEATRRWCPESPFIFMSTNKVYGDWPNRAVLVEGEMRYDYKTLNGWPEDSSTDKCTHSPFGVSKLAADLMVQEYGRYYGMPTVCLRAGCITGANHAGVELHGFLSYLVKCCVMGKSYKIYGYKGKQVRDNIDAYDVAAFIHEFVQAPRCGEVYNIGGGKDNSCSILEAIELAKQIAGRPFISSYNEYNRIGDHICYYSDLTKIKSHYPNWDVTVPWDVIVYSITRACYEDSKIKLQ